jgi:hypothetical protein
MLYTCRSLKKLFILIAITLYSCESSPETKSNAEKEASKDSENKLESDTNLPPINIGCCDVRIINEGDLNNDGADELSLFQAPVNGCVYSMTTHSFKNGNWLQIVKPFLIMTGCDGISNEELQKRIFTENNNIYYLDPDLNDENGALIKKKVIQ